MLDERRTTLSMLLKRYFFLWRKLDHSDNDSTKLNSERDISFLDHSMCFGLNVRQQYSDCAMSLKPFHFTCSPCSSLVGRPVGSIWTWICIYTVFIISGLHDLMISWWQHFFYLYTVWNDIENEWRHTVCSLSVTECHLITNRLTEWNKSKWVRQFHITWDAADTQAPWGP